MSNEGEKRVKLRTEFALIGVLAAGFAHGQLQVGDLYGIGYVSSTGVDTLYRIDKNTGVASAVFSFNRPTGGSVNGMAFNSVTQKFVSVRTNTALNYSLVEIDPVALTATVVSDGIPSNIFEGIEYSASAGGLVVSYSTTAVAATTNLALLDNDYSLITARGSIGMTDMDNLFLDENGIINSMDSNNPTSSFQRWRFTADPFTGAFVKTSVGSNIFSATRPDSDMAFDAVSGNLFVSMETGLGTVNVASTALTPVGNYGLDGSGNPIAIRGLAIVNAVPEPTMMTALGFAGAAALLRRRRRKK